MITLDQCKPYFSFFSDGMNVAGHFFMVFLCALFAMWLLKKLVDKDFHYLPSAPTLAELERRHKFLGILIDRKKLKLKGQSK